jgi:hypothetical protein
MPAKLHMLTKSEGKYLEHQQKVALELSDSFGFNIKFLCYDFMNNLITVAPQRLLKNNKRGSTCIANLFQMNPILCMHTKGSLNIQDMAPAQN